MNQMNQMNRKRGYKSFKEGNIPTTAILAGFFYIPPMTFNDVKLNKTSRAGRQIMLYKVVLLCICIRL